MIDKIGIFVQRKMRFLFIKCRNRDISIYDNDNKLLVIFYKNSALHILEHIEYIHTYKKDVK